jgi:hypothetical protein
VVVRVLIGLLLCLSSRLAGSHRPGAHRPGSVAAGGVLLADPVQRRQSGAVIAGRPPTMSGSQRRTQRAGLPASLRQQGAACTAPPCVATRSGLRCRRRRRGPQVHPRRGRADQSIARSAPYGASAPLPRGGISRHVAQLGERTCFGSSPKKARCEAPFPQDRHERSPPNQVVSQDQDVDPVTTD